MDERPFTIRPLTPDDRPWVARFIAERWGAEIVVAHGEVYRPHELPCFIAIENDEPIGLVTYAIKPCEGSYQPSQGFATYECEIVTLNSLAPNRGIGTALIDAVRTAARKSRCTRLWLITTNDNLHAQRFYQRRGFSIAAVHRGAVNESRKLKPEIPLIGLDGIPIRDKVELEERLEIGD